METNEVIQPSDNDLVLVSVVPSDPKTAENTLPRVFAVKVWDLPNFISEHLGVNDQLIVRYVDSY